MEKDLNILMQERIKNLDKNFIENFKFEKYKYNSELKNGLYAFDIETTTIADEKGTPKESITYATMLMDCYSENDVCLHNGNKKDLVNNLENLPYINSIIYAHNGGRFDYKCILDEFLKRGYKLNYGKIVDYDGKFDIQKQFTLSEEKEIKILFKNNTFYSIEIGISKVPIEFYNRKTTKNGITYNKGDVKRYGLKSILLKDSSLMLSGSLKDVCKDFLNLKLPKDGLDYKTFRNENYKLTEQEKIYCYEDVFSLKHLLLNEFVKPFKIEINGIEVVNTRKLDKLTSASFSYNILKDFIYYDCILTDNYKNNYTNKTLIDEITVYKKSLVKKNKNDLFRKIFPSLFLKEDNFSRETYQGGIVGTGEKIFHVNKGNKNEEYKYKHDEKGCLIDSNSMYPDKMKNYYLPFGKPKHITIDNFINYETKGKLKDYLYLIDFFTIGKVELKKGKFPMLRVGGELNPDFNKREIFTTNNINGVNKQLRLQLTSVDYHNFLDSYNVMHIVPKKVLIFEKCKGIFDTFINYFYEIKCNSKGSIKQNSKLILNSTYGKFGTKKVDSRYTVDYDNNLDTICYSKCDKQIISDSEYVPMASFITSYARQDLKEVAEKVGVKYIDYFDTDSLHFRKDKNYVISKYDKIHKTKLGYWDIEGEYQGGIYLGAKRYAENIIKDNETKWEVKCCGIPKDNQSIFENNIELFDYCNINKKEFEKGLMCGNIKPNSNSLYTFNNSNLIGVCVTNKSKIVKGGVGIGNIPYMLTKNNIY